MGPTIATAILDRLFHHLAAINIHGDSYRLKDQKEALVFPRPEGEGNRSGPLP